MIANHCYIKYNNGYINIKTKDNEAKLYIKDIEVVIFETLCVDVSLYLLSELEKNGVRVILCNEKHNPYGEIKSFYGTENMTGKIFQQTSWNAGKKTFVWDKIVKDKIKCQKETLNSLNINYPNDNEYNEANFAAIYFKKLFGRRFVRFSEDYINSALNYGYTLLLSKVNRIIINHGYLTQLGVHHCNKNNNYNLSCDVIEPFRPIVDKIVYNNKELAFDINYKRKLQKIFEERVMVNNKLYLIGDAMDIYVKNILDYLNDDNVEFCEIDIA